ncbi:hypothetical protein KGF57_003021 [Candida theae]|uniref:NADH dehydrogenase [ubiquinone] 1 alpha subcomplex subunit n=1 Tax=Candida theae TaxID=1198502 RepID=A0AAD5BEN3_9ASCO|nr:uncharacterized protein KGF57_003021 [Candida theae]KAI5957755.1 hypothetical protein KGF57_003021 [Candida theae]
MDVIKQKHPAWKRLLHKWQARRDIPFRRKFFVGYDLYGNTYWEFTIDGNLTRLRRKLEPFREEVFKVDYFKTIPPQWLQWLRRTRLDAPSLDELVSDQMRQQRLKILARQADEKWQLEKLRLEEENQVKLQQELQRVELENAPEISNVKGEGQNGAKVRESQVNDKIDEDPWKQADETRGKNPIQSTTIKPR